MTRIQQNAWWLSPAITIILAVIGGIVTWQTIVGDIRSEIATLETRINTVEGERDLIRKELAEIRQRTDQIYLLLAGR